MSSLHRIDTNRNDVGLIASGLYSGINLKECQLKAKTDSVKIREFFNSLTTKTQTTKFSSANFQTIAY